MSASVYIDGHAGTTGLRIRDWLETRTDIDLITLPDEHRKDTNHRREAILSADIAILCLPDEAAKEVAQWIVNSDTAIIDASTAHRINPDWCYGLPELNADHREKLSAAKKISNPGCYSSSSILMLRPIIDAGLINTQSGLYIHALSGYSGGGKGLIEKWENPESTLYQLPFETPYAYQWQHKHVPEITVYSGLDQAPYFIPAVGPFHSGMRVQIPLHHSLINASKDQAAEQLQACLEMRYRDEPFITVHPLDKNVNTNELAYDPRVCNGTNRIELRVLANPDGHITLMATLDNLGKGASGMAIQSLNLLLNTDETTSLPI